MFSLQAQLGPIIKKGDECPESAKQALVLKRQFEEMFRTAVRHAHSIGERLCVDVPTFPLQYDTASCLHFFAWFFTTLEETVQDLDSIVDEECRQLMSMAAMHAFSHISRIDPGFDFGRLLVPIPEELHLSLVNSVRDDVNAFVEAFKLQVVDDMGDPTSGGDDKTEGRSQGDEGNSR